MDAIRIKKENVEVLADMKFIKLFDLRYAPGRHYIAASRRAKEDLASVKTDEQFRAMLPDAVSCFVIIKTPREPYRLLLSYEYRYAAGRFLLSPPAGLIDEADRRAEDPLISAAIREIREETGISIKASDRIYRVNPCILSSPGFTDECNSLVCAVAELPDLCGLDQSGGEGPELFGGFELLDNSRAMEVLKQGRDKHGFFYSAYTWAALMYFVSGMWKEQSRET